jgi:hypothetical protein
MTMMRLANACTKIPVMQRMQRRHLAMITFRRPQMSEMNPAVNAARKMPPYVAELRICWV